MLYMWTNAWILSYVKMSYAKDLIPDIRVQHLYNSELHKYKSLCVQFFL